MAVAELPAIVLQQAKAGHSKSGHRLWLSNHMGRCEHAEMGKECRAVLAEGKMSAIPPKTESSLSGSFITGAEPCKGLLVKRWPDGEEVWGNEQTIDEDLCVIEGVADAL